MKIAFRILCLAGVMTLAPLQPTAAQEAPAAEMVDDDEAQAAPDSEAALAEAKAKMQKEIDEAIALVETIFETDKLPPVDPARFALAQQTTAALLPDGSLEKLLDNIYGKMFRAILDQAGGMSDMMLSIKTGVESDQIAALDAESKAAAAALLDPDRKQREDQTMKVIKPLVSEALADLEPPMREGLAKAYSRKYSAAQLGEINAFFATPTGRDYAANSMILQADPEVMVATIKAVPPLVMKFIDRAPELEGQFKELPKERTLADLNDAELAKLAGLMKVDVATLKDHRDAWSGDGEAADAMVGEPGDESAWDAAEAAADAAAESAGDDAAAWDPANWSEEDRKRVDELHAAVDAAMTQADMAEQDAVDNARKRLDAGPTE